MEFIADLHLHSHFSRATAKNLDLGHVARAAMLKGITVAGTGDFTHPGWFGELEEILEPAEDGLFRLKKEIEGSFTGSGGDSSFERSTSDITAGTLPGSCIGDVRFILQCEISSIYKRDGRVRKNHNLIFFPEMESVRAFNEKLGRIGNITSDGRPILGLDSEKLLEIMLETSDEAFMIPAHIWTPWFSMFGSKSGFDSVEGCFGSLAGHIFAVETGLSSDLPMNWRIENLDRMSFISSSDAHSPMFMGRNASYFDTSLSYYSIRDALKNSSDRGGYLGTIDMYPEEGKYHYDGHRKCNVCLNPRETAVYDGICPECGKPLTLGVLYRVQQLATRPEGYTPSGRHGFRRIIPLSEILSEICGTGAKSKKVELYYRKALARLGPELEILLKRDIAEVEEVGIPLLAEALKRMRAGEVNLIPGYDGEYGRVKLFGDDEIEHLKGNRTIFGAADIRRTSLKSDRDRNTSGNSRLIYASKEKTAESAGVSEDIDIFSTLSDCRSCNESGESASGKIIPDSHMEESDASCRKSDDEENVRKPVSTLNEEQQRAIDSLSRPLLMEAGPGTGKTKTLTEKIVSLITTNGVDPSSILALTFTNKASEEMRSRVAKLLEKESTDDSFPFISTFHGFCLMVLKEYSSAKFTIADETLRKNLIQQALKSAFPEKYRELSLSDIELAISLTKQNEKIEQDEKRESDEYSSGKVSPALGTSGSSDGESVVRIVLAGYQELLSFYRLVDFDDLMAMLLDLMRDDASFAASLKERFSTIFVDEYQDINRGQYNLIKLLAGDGRSLCVIGDPDQSIYGFRGADNSYFRRFEEDYPDTEKIVFRRNYRSTETILGASYQLITMFGGNRGRAGDKRIRTPATAADHTDHASTYQTDTSQIDTDKTGTDRIITYQIDSDQVVGSVAKERLFSGIEGASAINILSAPTEESQAVMIGKTIERLVGGISMFSMDAGKADSTEHDSYSFADIAVLFRTKRQADVLASVFEKAGIPFQRADSDNIFNMKGIREIISALRIVMDMGTLYDMTILLDHFGWATGKGVREKLAELFHAALRSGDSFPDSSESAHRGSAGSENMYAPFPNMYAPAPDSRKTGAIGRISISEWLMAIAEVGAGGLKWKDVSILGTEAMDSIRLLCESLGKKAKSDISEFALKITDMCRRCNGRNSSEALELVIEELSINDLIESSGDIRDTISRLRRDAKSYPDPIGFYENIAMKRDPDTVEYGAEKVSLMTMHASKGLEFRVVFIAGCENGLIPFYNSRGECEDIEEERRLLYVAMTRAQDLLYLSHAAKRRIFGRTVVTQRSVFLDDIEESLKHYAASGSRKAEKMKAAEQLELFGKI